MSVPLLYQRLAGHHTLCHPSLFSIADFSSLVNLMMPTLLFPVQGVVPSVAVFLAKALARPGLTISTPVAGFVVCSAQMKPEPIMGSFVGVVVATGTYWMPLYDRQVWGSALANGGKATAPVQSRLLLLNG